MRTTVNRHTFFPAAAAVACSLLLAACGSQERAQNTVYDFGAPSLRASAPATPPAAPLAVVVMDVTGPSGLDTERMFYRLNYADAQQARTYASSRWSATPTNLVTTRIKTRLSQAHMKVLSATDAANGIPILRIEIDDFVHAFQSAGQSEGRIMLRASVFTEHRLVDQRSFERSTPASTQDAAGGAAALAASTDGLADDIGAWLATLDLQGK